MLFALYDVVCYNTENKGVGYVFDKIRSYILSEKGKKLLYYGISGVITTIISFVSFKLFLDILNLHYILDFSMSWLLAVTFAYLSTRIKVYKSKANNKKEKAFEYTRFIIGRIITYVINLVLLMIAVEWFKLDEFWSNAVITVIVIVLNYFIGDVMINCFNGRQNKVKLNATSTKFICLIIIITILAVAVRLMLFNIESGDYVGFLNKWYDELKQNGGMSALSKIESDYNMPYLEILALLTYIPINKLYLIKAVSVIFDIVMAISVMILVSRLTNKNKKYMLLSYAITLFLPTVVLNSAAWAQCDSIYTTFIILALVKLIDKKYVTSILFYGVALAFKLQAIFILPVYAIVFLGNKDMLKKLIYAPLVVVPNIILSLPAIFYGKNVFSIFGTYGTQVSEYANYISQNISNIYHLIYFDANSFIATQSNVILVLMIAMTLIVFFSILVLVQKGKIKLEGKVVELAFYSVLVCVFLLPCMHDRYLYVAEVLAAVLFAKASNRSERIFGIVITILIQMVSLGSYGRFLFLRSGNNMIVDALVYMGIIVTFTLKAGLNERQLVICQ